MAASRKITQTVTGEFSIFRKEDIQSNREGDNTAFPTLSINQSVKNPNGDGYVNIQNIDLFPFSAKNVTFAGTLADLATGGNTRVVGTITMNLVKPHVASNGRVYTKWEVVSSELVPASQVPYAAKTEDAAAEAITQAVAAPVVDTAELPF